MGLVSKHRYPSKVLGRMAFIAMMLQFTFLNVQSQDFLKVKDLKGRWHFSIGDNPEWSQPNYDDNHWEKIHVPGSWEEQGFHGYDGYAWYRTTVELPPEDKLHSEEFMHATYYLKLGYIDDVDQVFINGRKIGQTGNFPPDYSTAFNANRLYPIPHNTTFKNGNLHIAVRVFDEGGEGGFIHGDISIVADISSINLNFDLQGEWKFKTGNILGIPDEQDFRDWEEIIVPGPWEDQGYKDYDGIAYYATEFDLNGRFSDERMVLVLGRIDDLDMTYLNGVLIGQSGEFKPETVHARSDSYKQIRGYYIPPEILNHDGKNTLVVKVLDVHGLGGIWDGSVGLITQSNYIQYWRNKRNSMR